MSGGMEECYGYGDAAAPLSSHYKVHSIEPINVIEDWGLNFNLGNVIKYIGRCDHKDNREADLSKALYYLEREYNRAYLT